MSQWTHILGVVRFDSMNKNVWPEPPNKEEALKAEFTFVDKCFQNSDIPNGSEGPIECQTIMTNRGPTVLLTGDLRDFGKEDLPRITEWLNALVKDMQEVALAARCLLFVRDTMVHCQVEFDETVYLISRNEDTPDKAFTLNKYSQSKADMVMKSPPRRRTKKELDWAIEKQQESLNYNEDHFAELENLIRAQKHRLKELQRERETAPD